MSVILRLRRCDQADNLFPPGSSPDAKGVLRGHLKHVMEKRNGLWKILSAQNTFIAAVTN